MNIFNVTNFLDFAVSASLHIILSAMVAVFISLLLYSQIVVRGTNLRRTLLEEDNFAAWLEITLGLTLPIIWMASSAVSGEVSLSFANDILATIGYTVAYCLVFIVIRKCVELLMSTVKLQGSGCNEDGKSSDNCSEYINLSHEIYIQKNINSSLFSSAISALVASSVVFIDIFNMVPSLIQLGQSAFLSLILYLLIKTINRKKINFKELFADDNPAIGIYNYLIAISIAFFSYNLIKLSVQTEAFSLVEIIAFTVLVFFIFTQFAEKCIDVFLKGTLSKELIQDNNIGLAFFTGMLYVGTAWLVIGCIS